jgi:hypothetical protein
MSKLIKRQRKRSQKETARIAAAKSHTVAREDPDNWVDETYAYTLGCATNYSYPHARRRSLVERWFGFDLRDWFR